MSNWKQTTITLLADLLRLSIRVCLFIDGILAAMFSIWLCAKLLYFAINWLNRTVFGTPW
jgi:hypothetical protein